MKWHRRSARLDLSAGESGMLQRLLDELRTVIADEDVTSDPVRQRLFPSAYPDDADAEAEYRSLTESSLRTERLERIDACSGELAAGDALGLGDDDAARRWLQVLNDLRLALGTRLGVTEDPPDIDPADPQAQPWLIYGWLTELQDVAVRGVMPS